MKKILLLILLSISIDSVYASKNEVAGTLAAGIVLTAIALSDNCEFTDYSNYKFDTEMAALPGNAVIDQKRNACRQEKLVLHSPIHSSNTNHDIKLKVGESVSRPDGGESRVIEVGKDTFGDSLKISVDSSGVVSSSKDIFNNINGEKLFTPKDYILVRKETFSQEVIYTGISGNTIHFLYREYSGDMIRYPFNLQLSFDLSKSKKIQIKSWSIEVISADNESIRYVVKS